MIVLLIILIFALLFYILHISSKESFEADIPSTSSKSQADIPSTSSNSQANSDTTFIYTLNNKFNGPIAYIKNISSFSNGFYQPSDNRCTDHNDCIGKCCSKSGDCDTSSDEDEKVCNKIINKEAFKFISNYKSHIVIPNVNPNNINLNLIVMITELPNQVIPIISTNDGSWNLIIKDKNFVIQSLFNTDEEIKPVSFKEMVDVNKIYEIIVNVNNNNLNVSIKKETGEQSLNTIKISKQACSDKPCKKNGYCERNHTNDKYCTYSTIELHLGNDVNETKDKKYFDGYIGDIFLNSDNNDKIKCNFNLTSSNQNLSKNKSRCLEECKRTDPCQSSECERICADVPICEFKPTGRHSEDCIKYCKMDNDCDDKHCEEECRNCGQNCPWNNDDSMHDDLFYDTDTGRPHPPRISIINISPDGKNVSLRWKQSKQDSDSEMNTIGYILYLYKTFNKGDGVQIKNILNKVPICNKYCNYILEGLNPEETYTIGIKGYNKNGLGEISNLETFKTDRQTISQDYTIVPNIDESIIGEFNYCNIEEEE